MFISKSIKGMFSEENMVLIYLRAESLMTYKHTFKFYVLIL